MPRALPPPRVNPSPSGEGRPGAAPGRLRRGSGWPRQSRTSPSPPDFSPTAISRRYGKPYFLQAAERRGFPRAARSCLPPGQNGFPRVFGRGGFGTRFRLQVAGPLFFPCLALFLSQVGVFPRGFGDLQMLGSSGRCGTAAAPPLLPVGSLLLSTPVLAPSPCRPPAWDARGVSPPPRSPPPTAPEPLTGFAGRGCKAGPAATQGAGRSGGFGAGLRRGSADGGLLWGPERRV